MSGPRLPVWCSLLLRRPKSSPLSLTLRAAKAELNNGLSSSSGPTDLGLDLQGQREVLPGPATGSPVLWPSSKALQGLDWNLRECWLSPAATKAEHLEPGRLVLSAPLKKALPASAKTEVRGCQLQLPGCQWSETSIQDKARGAWGIPHPCPYPLGRKAQPCLSGAAAPPPSVASSLACCAWLHLCSAPGGGRRGADAGALPGVTGLPTPSWGPQSPS